MNLHLEDEAFRELIFETAKSMVLPQLYVEKDYWITRTLKHLSKSDYTNIAILKGGTSLSKAYRLIDRFSEDIDLAVIADDLGSNQRKMLLKSIEREVSKELTNLPFHDRESKGSNFRRTVYHYPRVIAGEEFGQVASHLILELNTFGNPYPMTTKNVRTLIAEEIMRTRSGELLTQYGLEDFEIQVLSVERTFVEKLISVVKNSYETNAAKVLSEKIRHLYDLSYILKQEDIRKFLGSDEFHKMCKSCIENERRGNFDNSEHLLKPLADAPLFSEFLEWRRFLEIAWQGKFKELVYGGMPSMDEIQSMLETIRIHL